MKRKSKLFTKVALTTIFMTTLLFTALPTIIEAKNPGPSHAIAQSLPNRGEEISKLAKTKNSAVARARADLKAAKKKALADYKNLINEAKTKAEKTAARKTRQETEKAAVKTYTEAITATKDAYKASVRQIKK